MYLIISTLIVTISWVQITMLPINIVIIMQNLSAQIHHPRTKYIFKPKFKYYTWRFRSKFGFPRTERSFRYPIPVDSGNIFILTIPRNKPLLHTCANILMFNPVTLKRFPENFCDKVIIPGTINQNI